MLIFGAMKANSFMFQKLDRNRDQVDTKFYGQQWMIISNFPAQDSSQQDCIISPHSFC